MAQLIVALDVPSAEAAEALVDQLYELDVILKIGLESLCGYPQRILSYCEARDVRVFVDPKSFIYLHGMILDYEETLMRQGFNFINPHSTKSCGCGSSFSA